MKIEKRLCGLRLASGVVPPVAAPRVTKFVLRSTEGNVFFATRVRSVTGSALTVSTADYHGLPFATRGYHTWRNVVVAALAAKGTGVVVEVGANVGTETVSLGDVSGRVIAIEPDPDNLAWLRQLQGPKVEVVGAAASQRPGVLSFQPPPERHRTGIGRIDAGGELEVPVVTVDEVTEGLGVSAILIDTEGHEPQVLLGATETINRCRPVIVAECEPGLLHHAGSSEQELVDLLRQHDYEVWQMARWGLSTQLARGDWLALPSERSESERYSRALLASALIPPALNPIFRRGRRPQDDSLSWPGCGGVVRIFSAVEPRR